MRQSPMIEVLKRRVQHVKDAPLMSKATAAEKLAESTLAWATDIENRLQALEARP